MKTHVSKGTRSEIADAVARMDGVIREVIVFVKEPAELTPTEEDMFAEMETLHGQRRLLRGCFTGGHLHADGRRKP